MLLEVSVELRIINQKFRSSTKRLVETEPTVP